MDAESDWRDLERQARQQGLTRPVAWRCHHGKQFAPPISPMARDQSGRASSFGRLYLQAPRGTAA